MSEPVRCRTCEGTGRLFDPTIKRTIACYDCSPVPSKLSFDLEAELTLLADAGPPVQRILVERYREVLLALRDAEQRLARLAEIWPKLAMLLSVSPLIAATESGVQEAKSLAKEVSRLLGLDKTP